MGCFFLVVDLSLESFFFLPRPQVPMKGGGAPILGDPPPRLPILGAPLSVIPLITSRASGIPMVAKILPIPFPTCFGVTLKSISFLLLSAFTKSLLCFPVNR